MKSGFIVLLLVGLLVAMPVAAGVLGAPNGLFGPILGIGTKIESTDAVVGQSAGVEVTAFAAEGRAAEPQLVDVFPLWVRSDDTSTIAMIREGTGDNSPFT